MDRTIVYPSAIPLDTDLLYINRNIMIGLGLLAQAVLGTDTVVDGLACQPTAPASMSVVIGTGSITQLGSVDNSPYGSIPADTATAIVRMGINTTPTTFTLTAPQSVGQSANYLIQASFQEVDDNPTVLPYYNASNPAQSFSGPSNSGSAQNTVRKQRVLLQLKAGTPANTGSQVTPAADAGCTGLYQIELHTVRRRSPVGTFWYFRQPLSSAGSCLHYGQALALACRVLPTQESSRFLPALPGSRLRFGEAAPAVMPLFPEDQVEEAPVVAMPEGSLLDSYQASRYPS